MIGTIAGTVAPAATMIAAMMTAANAGARVTGWGFVLFAIGAVAWIVDAIATGQRNLLLTNAFLLAVDLFGIWRWLGRQARYDEGARTAGRDSAATPAATLFPVGALVGMPVRHGDAPVGTVAEAMAACDDGRVAYLVVTRGGIGGVGERLHALAWDEVRYRDGALETTLPPRIIDRRPRLDRARWPATTEAACGN